MTHSRQKQKRQYYLNTVVQRRKEMRLWLNEIKSTMKCSRCPETHIATLDFHHSDPLQKDNQISNMIRNNNTKEKILEEISKCEVLCSNCHRKLHYEETWSG